MSQKLESLLSKPFGDETDPRGFWLLLMEHIANMKVRNYSVSTMRLRMVYVRNFALWCLDRDLRQPAMITKPMLESFQRHLYRHRKSDGKPLAWSTQSGHLQEVNQFFRYLVKMNHLPFNPAAELELPKQPKSLPKAILSADEVERILSEPDTTTAIGLRDRAIFEVLYSSGLRRFELCGLRIEQVDVERKTIFIKSGKGQKDRYVPIGLRALLWIARYVENGREKLLLLDPKEATLVSDQGRQAAESRFANGVSASLHQVFRRQQRRCLPHFSSYDGDVDVGQRRRHPPHPSDPRPRDDWRRRKSTLGLRFASYWKCMARHIRLKTRRKSAKTPMTVQMPTHSRNQSAKRPRIRAMQTARRNLKRSLRNRAHVRAG